MSTRQPNPDAIAHHLARSFPRTAIMSHPLTGGDSSWQWAIDTGKVKVKPPARSPARPTTAQARHRAAQAPAYTGSA